MATKGQWYVRALLLQAAALSVKTQCYRVVAVTNSLHSKSFIYSYYFAAKQQLPAAGHALGVEDHRAKHLANGYMVAGGGAYSVGWRTIERTLFLWFVRVAFEKSTMNERGVNHLFWMQSTSQRTMCGAILKQKGAV